MRVRRLSPSIAALCCAALGSGCFPFRGSGGTHINSTASDYSPVVTFSAKVQIRDSVLIAVDRLRIVAPGEVFEGAKASTGEIQMQALLVTANPDGVTDRNGSRKPWVERSASAPLRVVDSLTMGIPQTAGPFRYSIPVPSGFSPSDSWLVFRISGPAKAMPAMMADGTPAPAFQLPDIRVFACAMEFLDGKKDKAREVAMKQMYSMGC